MDFPTTRMRRLRYHPTVRDLVAEAELNRNDLVLPVFIHHGKGVKRPIPTLPGHSQLSVDQLPREIAAIRELGISAVMLFGIPESKDSLGSDSYRPEGIIQNALRVIKGMDRDLLVMTDVCFCEYTDHGHCGVVNETTGRHDVDNDATLALLAKQVVSHAQAGSDVMVPSGMMDGQVATLRSALDKAGFSHIPILSHAAKYASALYGAFRVAVDCTLQFGDRKSYQMDVRNGEQALREIGLDVQEGADMVLIKPATPYLDVIYRAKRAFPAIPLAAYQVSGEYAMIKAAAANGWIDERAVVLETLTAIKRAGADFIINYFCKDVATWL